MADVNVIWVTTCNRPTPTVEKRRKRSATWSLPVICCFGCLIIVTLASGLLGSLLASLLGFGESDTDVPITSRPTEKPVIHCASVSAPANGNVAPIITTFPQGIFLSFTCNSGFVLDGSEEIQCLANGIWSDNVPICIRTESNIQLSVDGIVTFPNNLQTLKQDRHRFTCVMTTNSEADFDIRWDLQNLGVIQYTSPQKISTTNNDNSHTHQSSYELVIRRLFGNEGVVTCSAVSNGQEILSTSVRIIFEDILLRLEIDRTAYDNGDDVTLDEGHHTFTCIPIIATSYDVPVTWKVDTRLVSDSSSYERNVQERDCGKQIECMVKDDTSPARQVTLLVKRNPTSAVLSVDESNIIKLASGGTVLQVVDGTSIDVQCTVSGADGQPVVTISLNRNSVINQEYPGSEDNIDCVTRTVTHTFNFVATFSEDQDKELCCSAEGVEDKLLIDILVPPSCYEMAIEVDGIQYESGSVVNVIGPKHNFKCIVFDTKPSCMISWQFDDEPFPERNREFVVKETGLVDTTDNMNQNVAGDTTVTCSADNGVQSAKDASIFISIVVGCEAVSALDNGNVAPSLTSFPHGTVLSFICDGGFLLEGSDETECSENGMWSENVPICIDCDTLDLFTCASGACISSSLRCDGKDDCPDGDDEDCPACQFCTDCNSNIACFNAACGTAMLAACCDLCIICFDAATCP